MPAPRGSNILPGAFFICIHLPSIFLSSVSFSAQSGLASDGISI
jgi:hypothetical protein